MKQLEQGLKQLNQRVKQLEQHFIYKNNRRYFPGNNKQFNK